MASETTTMTVSIAPALKDAVEAEAKTLNYSLSGYVGLILMSRDIKAILEQKTAEIEAGI